MANARTPSRSVRRHSYTGFVCLTSATGIKPSSFKPPGCVEQDGGRQSTFTNSKYFDCRHVTASACLEVGPKSTWGGQALVHFLGLPEWSREMKIRKSIQRFMAVSHAKFAWCCQLVRGWWWWQDLERLTRGDDGLCQRLGRHRTAAASF
jgi:hypothetical protein